MRSCGENAARTSAYLLTVTATPGDGGAPLHLAVRVMVVGTADGRRARMLQIGLAGFSRTVASTAVQVIGRRFTPPAETDALDLAVTLNGRSLGLAEAGGAHARAELAGAVIDALGIRARPDGAVAWDAPSGAQLVGGSSFSVEQGAAGSRWGVWGSGDLSGFSGDVDGFRQDGTVLSAYLGADYRFVPNARAGLAASWSRLDLTSASETEGDATLQGTLGQVYPYLFWMPDEWLGIWGLAGLGTGTAELTTAGGTFRSPGLLRSWLGAAGQRAELWSGGGVSLAAKSDGFVTGIRQSVHDENGDPPPDVNALAWRARLLVEAGLETRLQDARLSGQVELGARLDGGDAERGVGAEAGAEIAFTHTGTGLGLAARGRLLLVHEDANVRDWGASATLAWQPSGHGSGPSLSVAPAWGRPASGMDALWQDPRAVLASAGEPGGSAGRPAWPPDRLDVAVSYGLDGLELEAFAGSGYRFGLSGSLEY